MKFRKIVSLDTHGLSSTSGWPHMVQTLYATLDHDMPDELLFMQRSDEAKGEIQRIVDMPDKLISMMLTFLHQNEGVFPKRRREYFDKLTDDEIRTHAENLSACV